MRVAYFDCARGISGGATLAALLDAGADVEELAARLGVFGVDRSRIRLDDTMVGPFRARTVSIVGGDEQVGRGLSDMEALITAASLPDAARDIALGVYRRLAEAEARVHASETAAVRFHEVGSLRSFVGVVGTALASEDLGIERIFASALPFGHGTVETAHGRIPVPAPATLELLREIPVEPQDAEGELVTPTGVAILAVAASGFGAAPAMTIERVGYGTGGPAPNGVLLRVVVGESPEHS
ncbi:MAG: LarC family nickel insertion protein [Actinomycetota bacterium]